VFDAAGYDAIDAVNFSTLKVMRLSAKHYQHELEERKAGGDDEAAHFRVGRCVHTLLLEPEKFESSYTVFDGDKRTKDWKLFKVANADRCILGRAEYTRAVGMARAVLGHPEASRYLERLASGAKVESTTPENFLSI
jgi:hypothetical protein